MEVKKIVLHRIDKEKKEKGTLKFSNKLMEIDETVIGFVERLIKIYNSKNPSQGTFEEDDVNYPFQVKVKEYLENQDFLTFTTDAMHILKSRMDINTTTGGYVVFIHYVEKQVDFIISSMMDKDTQYTNTEELGIQKLMTLNIEKLARANRLNLDKWKNNNGRYLTFIKGTRAVSQYFVKFIGATDISSAKENFKKLKDTIKQYVVEEKISRKQQDAIREKVSSYINKCFLDKSDVEIESVSAIVNTQSPLSFLEFISKNEIEISGRIGIHSKGDFDNFTRSILKEDGYHLVFEKELIKKGKITRDGNCIVIHDVPTDKLNSTFDIINSEKDESITE
ncbi:nucleoid-associated protein [Flavobacterium humidisoli]|uniref:Nucleoid-associated protein n=1 Tax=Flavobacterium humidisoli TaxID=2937442 RepID=A0ABY4LUY8_9FLAO|nr:nucleoid-associated protein [Flavobacterium humidisoli]UPZ16899.1 nucleoid-associated protein [Flavobacterium humidisoli]